MLHVGGGEVGRGGAVIEVLLHHCQGALLWKPAIQKLQWGRRRRTHPKVRREEGSRGRRHRSIVDDRGVTASKSGLADWMRRRKIA